MVTDIHQAAAAKQEELRKHVDEFVELKQKQITKLQNELEAWQIVRQALHAEAPAEEAAPAMPSARRSFP